VTVLPVSRCLVLERGGLPAPRMSMFRRVPNSCRTARPKTMRVVVDARTWVGSSSVRIITEGVAARWGLGEGRWFLPTQVLNSQVRA